MINEKRIEDLYSIKGSDGKPYFLTLHRVFMEETISLFDQSQHQLKEDNQEEISKLFTILSTTAGALGATELSLVAAQIVNQIAKSETENIADKLKEARELFEKTEIEIQNLIEKQKGLNH